MTILHVKEFTHLAVDSRGNSVAAPMYPPINEFELTLSTVSASRGFTSMTRFVDIYASAACNIVVGDATATAVTTVGPMGSGERMFIGVVPGSYIAVVTP